MLLRLVMHARSRALRSLVLVSLASAGAALLVAACGGATKGDRGGTSGLKPGDACEAEEGDQPVASGDGCNSCMCMRGTWACTRTDCADGGSAGSTCAPGSTR